MVSLFYKGNKVYCPVCNSTFRKFLPYGHVQTRKNALCPKCFSLERHRLIWLYLQNRSHFFIDQLKVLHIAPEQCFYKRFKKQANLEYITGDLESPIADVKFDIQEIPFADNSYDVVICNHVYEHVPDDKQAMAEIYRIVKPGGFAISLVPVEFDREQTYEDPSITDPRERQKHFNQKDHYRIYGKDFPERMKEAGFKVTENNYLEEFTVADKEKYGLMKQENMFAYRK
jgi:SAM-dependent methyltransferase